MYTSQNMKGLARRVEEEHKGIDYGRVFGWWLRLRGRRIAELNYRRWDSDSQFWHEYFVVPFSAEFAEIGLDSNRLAQADVSVESRFAIGYSQEGVFMAPRDNAIVRIRNLSLPKDIFERAFIHLLGESTTFKKDEDKA
jgi:hypothetical protein